MANIGNYPIYPVGPQVNPDLPIYRPPIQRGLLGDQAGNDLVSRFAGGLLAGQQYRPATNPTQYGLAGGSGSGGGLYPGSLQMVPTQPTGVVTTEQPDGYDTTADTEVASGAYSMRDLMNIERAMARNRTQFSGFTPSTDPFDYLEATGDGGYNFTSEVDRLMGGEGAYIGRRGSEKILWGGDMTAEDKMKYFLGKITPEGGITEGGGADDGAASAAGGMADAAGSGGNAGW